MTRKLTEDGKQNCLSHLNGKAFEGRRDWDARLSTIFFILFLSENYVSVKTLFMAANHPYHHFDFYGGF